MQDLFLTPGATWAVPIIEMRRAHNIDLSPAIENFRNNFLSTHALATLLSNLIVPTMVIERAMQPFVESYIGGQLVLHRGVTGIQLENFVNNSLRSHFEDHPRSLQEEPSETYINMRDQAYAKIQTISNISPVTRKAIDAWFFSQITGIWTAFEVLSQELWYSSIRCYENILLEKIDSIMKSGCASGDEIDLVQYDLKCIRFSISSKQRFASLKGIRAAYKSSFHQEQAFIIFLLNSDPFTALAKLRNLIVHTGGIFDNEYLESTSSIIYAPKGSIDASLSLNAQKVYDLLYPVAVQCRDLIYAIDDFIFAKKPQ